MTYKPKFTFIWPGSSNNEVQGCRWAFRYVNLMSQWYACLFNPQCECTRGLL